MAILANDLRVGNWVRFLNKTFQAGAGTIEDCKKANDSNSPYKYEPILIEANKLWLEKFGFKKSPAGNSFYLPITELRSEIHFEEFRGKLLCVLYCGTGSFIPNDIKFVHQLQNLYHSITGKELELA